MSCSKGAISVERAIRVDRHCCKKTVFAKNRLEFRIVNGSKEFFTRRSCVMRKLAFVIAVFAGVFPLAIYAQENSLLDKEFCGGAVAQDVIQAIRGGVDT